MLKILKFYNLEKTQPEFHPTSKEDFSEPGMIADFLMIDDFLGRSTLVGRSRGENGLGIISDVKLDTPNKQICLWNIPIEAETDQFESSTNDSKLLGVSTFGKLSSSPEDLSTSGLVAIKIKETQTTLQFYWIPTHDRDQIIKCVSKFLDRNLRQALGLHKG